jgi:heptaprenyl diphosphate synthase
MSARDAVSVPPRADRAMSVIKQELDRVSVMLAEVSSAGESVLGEALPHLFRCNGKLLRPLLAVASCLAAGGSQGSEAMDCAVRSAAAVELLHVGTLCHDDVMDSANIRRGGPSVNAQWGNSVAILTGDILLARAVAIVTELGPDHTRILAQTLEDLCEGQAAESASLFDASRSRAAYLRVADLKTASLFAASCQLGALSAGLDTLHSRAFAAFGRSVGVAFQIVDDILDLVGSEEILGKPPCTDLRSGVLTLPVIEAVRRVPRLRELISEQVSSVDVSTVHAMILDSQAIGDVAAEVGGYIAEARRILSTAVGVDIDYVDTLTNVAESMLQQGLVAVGAEQSETLLGAVEQWRIHKAPHDRITQIPLAEAARHNNLIGDYR